MPGVLEVAVVAAPDPRLGEHGCAFIRLDGEAREVALPALQAHLEASGLGRQKWPEEVRVVDDLPRTPSGKVRKADLRRQLREERGSGLRSAGAAHEPPGTGAGVPAVVPGDLPGHKRVVVTLRILEEATAARREVVRHPGASEAQVLEVDDVDVCPQPDLEQPRSPSP